MDVRIGRLHLVARVVGPAHRAPRSDVVDLLTGDAARRRILQALTSAFDGEEVLVIRSLTCRATLRAAAAAGPDVLAGSIAASASQLLREHPSDDDCVVRFADEAAYVAAYIHDWLDGHHRRWYFDVFEPYRRIDGTMDWAALLAAHRERRWRILAQVRVNGNLETLLSTVDEGAARNLVADLDGAAGGWEPLVATAAAIVGGSTGPGQVPSPAPDLTAALAMTEPPPDWLDAASLGSAIGIAATGLLDTSNSIPAEEPPDLALMAAAAQRYDWFDTEAFGAALSLRADREENGHSPTAIHAPTPALSPRSRQVLAELSRTVGDPRLVLDADRPTSAANLIRLFTALVERSPRWADDDLARSLVTHILRVWEQRRAGSAPRVGTRQESGAEQSPEPEAVTARPQLPGGPPTGQPPASSAAPGPPGDDGRSQTEQPSEVPDDVSARWAAPPPGELSPRSVAAQLDARFPRTDWHGLPRESATASGLLLLRSVLDLGLAPYLLWADDAGEPVLAALLRRWAGQPAAGDPLLALVQDGRDAYPAAAEGRANLWEQAARRMLGQRLVTAPFRLVTVPYAVEEFASVIIDSSAHLLPLGSLAAPETLRRSIDAISDDIGLHPAPTDADALALVADALACVATGDGSTADRPRELKVDLLALSCVQAWARWLPGFAGARVPYLLATLVRRPARIVIAPTEIIVHLPPRSHDIVLELAGYLEPVDAGPLLGGRIVRFVTGGSHGR